MELQKTLHDLLIMLPDERKAFIKQLTKDNRQAIVLAMNLPKNISQKALCNKIEEMATFVKVAKV